MINFFVYKMVQIHGMPKPILLEQMTKKEFDEDEMPDVQAQRKAAYNDPNYTYKVSFKKLKMLGWTGNIYYARNLPEDYYELDDGFLVEPNATKTIRSSYQYTDAFFSE